MHLVNVRVDARADVPLVKRHACKLVFNTATLGHLGSVVDLVGGRALLVGVQARLHLHAEGGDGERVRVFRVDDRGSAIEGQLGIALICPRLRSTAFHDENVSDGATRIV